MGYQNFLVRDYPEIKLCFGISISNKNLLYAKKLAETPLTLLLTGVLYSDGTHNLEK